MTILHFRGYEEFEEDDEEPKIDSIMKDESEEEANEREAKFMIYWTTIVKTSWTTAYTQTSTLATIFCTPSGFAFSVCGGK